MIPWYFATMVRWYHGAMVPQSLLRSRESLLAAKASLCFTVPIRGSTCPGYVATTLRWYHCKMLLQQHGTIGTMVLCYHGKMVSWYDGPLEPVIYKVVFARTQNANISKLIWSPEHECFISVELYHHNDFNRRGHAAVWAILSHARTNTCIRIVFA